jgi:hypothetical protein
MNEEIDLPKYLTKTRLLVDFLICSFGPIYLQQRQANIRIDKSNLKSNLETSAYPYRYIPKR